MEDTIRHIQNTLTSIQQGLLQAAQERLQNKTIRINSYAEMKKFLSSADSVEHGFYLAPWCCDASNEQAIKEETKVTLRCYPFEHNEIAPKEGIECFYSGKQATHMAIFARAY